MTVPGIPPEPLRATCDGCGAEGFTYDMARAGAAVECSCCPVAHDHDEAANACRRLHEGPCAKGVPGCAVCRPVTVHGRAHLTLLDLGELLDALPPAVSPQDAAPVTDPA